jgi:quercetin dioxygenase-like cupin family protein
MEPLVVDNEQVPVLESGPGRRSRVLAGHALGARHMAVAEQWLDPGAGMPMHRHPDDCEEVFWIVSGTAEVRIDDEAEVVESDCTVIVPPGSLHGFTALGGEPLHLWTRWSRAIPTVLGEDGAEGDAEVPGI